MDDLMGEASIDSLRDAPELPRLLLLLEELPIPLMLSLSSALNISQKRILSSADAEQIVVPLGDFARCNTRAECPRNS